LVEDGLLVKPSLHIRGSLKAQRFQTAEAAARCQEHDQQQQPQQQAPTLVFAPINRLPQFLLQLPLPEPVGTLADTFAKAGRDEADSTPLLVFNWRPLPVDSVWFSWQPLPPEPIEAG
jgi:hypothetical protein